MMRSTGIQFKLLEQTFSGSQKWCADRKCPRLIKSGEMCFIDLLTDNADVLCEGCGKCLRYARKKAVSRGEPLESATQD